MDVNVLSTLPPEGTSMAFGKFISLFGGLLYFIDISSKTKTLELLWFFDAVTSQIYKSVGIWTKIKSEEV